VLSARAIAPCLNSTIFFDVVAKEPTAVTTEGVLEFLQDQRKPFYDGKVVRLSDGESGLRASIIKGRLSPVSGFYAYLAWSARSVPTRCLEGSPPAGPTRPSSFLAGLQAALAWRLGTARPGLAKARSAPARLPRAGVRETDWSPKWTTEGV
jgi:hypothetical protein